MCSSKAKLQETRTDTSIVVNGRPVLEPKNCNRAPLLERRNSINCPSTTTITTAAAARRIDHHRQRPAVLLLNKSKSFTERILHGGAFKYTSSAIVEAPGTIAAARREQVAIFQEQRKMRIAHYGRPSSSRTTTTSSNSISDNKPSPAVATNLLPATALPPDDDDDHHHINNNDHQYYSSSLPNTFNNSLSLHHEKRCSFITPNSDPIYVAYHDEEWGVPVHDDRLLFELLVLTGAQVGSDWTSVLKRRQDFREAFSGFDAEAVSILSEKKMSWISAEYGIEMSLVRGVVDNSKRILEIKKELGSFDKYLWGFVNHKAIVTRYKWCQKIPAKTSKSETISKDMVRRGFRLVGPTVIHSFMQAAGFTNDHLVTCPRHHATHSLISK